MYPVRTRDRCHGDSSYVPARCSGAAVGRSWATTSRRPRDQVTRNPGP